MRLFTYLAERGMNDRYIFELTNDYQNLIDILETCDSYEELV